MSKEPTKSSSSDPSQRAAAAAPPSPPRKSPPKAVPPAAEKTPRKRPAPKPSTPVEPVRNQITSGTLRISKHILQGFLDVFSQQSQTQGGETLSFSENSLSLFKRLEDFSKFPEFFRF